MEMKRHDLIEQHMCNALDEIETRLKQGQKMSPNDYEQVRVIYSALIKKKGYEGMLEYEDYEDDMEGNSGRRGRASNGRYMSMDTRKSYDDGYARGFSEAMNEIGNSGHYPMMPYYPRNNRW